MIRSQRTFARAPVRITATVIAAALWIITVVVAPQTPTVFAGGDRTALFGTVTGNPRDGLLEVVTRDGVITLAIDDHTKIGAKKGKMKFSDVTAGMSVAGYYTTGDDGPVARNLTFVTRKQKKSYEHVVGVVLDRKGKTFTVKTSKGEHVDIEFGDDAEGSKAEPGSMIATVVEHDSITGKLKTTAVQTARETVERLSRSIDRQISLAQKKLLKIRMSETAAVHLTRLYETLDEIQAETQARIEAAYAEFQSSYEATLKANLQEPITVHVSGKVLSVSSEPKIHVKSDSDGTRWHLDVTDATVVERSDGTTGTIADIVPGQMVEIDATPKSPTSGPVAKVIRVVTIDSTESDLGIVQNNNTITGTIILVETDPQTTDKVVVIGHEDGSDSAASIASGIVVVVDGEQLSVDELVAGQEVEITLADDGFTAQEVQAVAPAPVVDDASGDSIAPAEYTITGTIRFIDDTGVMLDGVQLKLIGPSVTFGTASVGDQVELQFIVDDSGSLVVTGANKAKNLTPQAAANAGNK